MYTSRLKTPRPYAPLPLSLHFYICICASVLLLLLLLLLSLSLSLSLASHNHATSLVIFSLVWFCQKRTLAYNSLTSSTAHTASLSTPSSQAWYLGHFHKQQSSNIFVSKWLTIAGDDEDFGQVSTPTNILWQCSFEDTKPISGLRSSTTQTFFLQTRSPETQDPWNPGKEKRSSHWSTKQARNTSAEVEDP